MEGNLSKHDLVGYLWREYDFGGRVYHIDRPVELYTATEGTTHRIVDAEGTVHVVPAVGYFGCVVRYRKEDDQPKVTF
jgi:hypothetical protein